MRRRSPLAIFGAVLAVLAFGLASDQSPSGGARITAESQGISAAALGALHHGTDAFVARDARSPLAASTQMRGSRSSRSGRAQELLRALLACGILGIAALRRRLAPSLVSASAAGSRGAWSCRGPPALV